MKRLQRWGMGVLAAIATFTIILGVNTHLTSAQDTTPQDTSPTPPITFETAGLSLEPIADGVYGLIASTDFPPADFATTAICNGAIVMGTDSVLVIDPFQNEALANLMFSTVETLTELPVAYGVNTHYHFDHTGGNAAVEARDIPILGRGPIRDFMINRNGEMDPNPTPPSVIVNGMGDIWLGDRQVHFEEIDGHSGGTDLVAYIPDVDVLIAGDLFFNQRIPYMADGDIRLWQQGLERLIANYPTATVLPGHGPVSDTQGLETQKTYLEQLEAIALAWKESGVSQNVAVTETELPAEYADYMFQALFPGNLEVAYQQITLGRDVDAMELSYDVTSPDVQGL